MQVRSQIVQLSLIQNTAAYLRLFVKALSKTIFSNLHKIKIIPALEVTKICRCAYWLKAHE